MRTDDMNTSFIKYDADYLRYLDEVLQAEEQSHTEYLD
jgi:hypothetical protein